MRDYKNVKVPAKHRSRAGRGSVKRVEAGRGRRKGGASLSRLLGSVLPVLVLLLAAAAVWLSWQAYGMITHADWFQISGVDVRGVHEIKDAELKSIVGPFTGQNIFRVDLEAAARRARANPWIRDVRIHRRLPNRITMEVVERVPAAVLETDMGRYLVDHEEFVIDRAVQESAAERQLPTVVIRDLRTRPGESVMTDRLSEALTLLAEIESRGGWKPADVTIRAASPESLSVVYAGHEFKIGSGRYAEKLRRLAEVMADVKQRNLDIAYVDLRAESQAAVMAVKTARGPGVMGAKKNPGNKRLPADQRH
ncbi:MAG TPA: FtsQ-type POTRA domain-containing protein [Nitrospirota bacterium]|nr:FtsQ-type POTRA domain-containing protein [Nitrospirota bacterium]